MARILDNYLMFSIWPQWLIVPPSRLLKKKNKEYIWNSSGKTKYLYNDTINLQINLTVYSFFITIIQRNVLIIYIVRITSKYDNSFYFYNPHYEYLTFFKFPFVLTSRRLPTVPSDQTTKVSKTKDSEFVFNVFVIHYLYVY